MGSARARDAGIELLRVVACLIVIGTHVKFDWVAPDGSADLSRTLVACLLADGVAVFWMITGCFLFRERSYPGLLRHTARSILLPVLVMSALVYVFWGVVAGGTTLAASPVHSAQENLGIVRSLLSWTNPFPQLAHLWYLYVYALAMLLFPFSFGMVRYLDERPARWRAFLAVTLALFAVNDLVGNGLFGFSHHSINGAVPAIVYMMWGHWLYARRERMRGWARVALPLCLFLALNLVRAVLLAWATGAGGASSNLISWTSGFGLLTASCLLVACLSLLPRDRDAGSPGVVRRAVGWLGSYTFLIYLVHLPLYSAAVVKQVQIVPAEAIAARFGEATPLSDAIQVLMSTAIVFAVSLLVAVACRRLWRLALRVRKLVRPHAAAR